jgi:hypothetical protein
MALYSHRQFGTVIAGSIAAAVAACLTLVCIVPGAGDDLVILPMVAILVIAGILFSSLTVEVTDRVLSWRFGPGWIRKQVNLSEVERIEVIRIHWLWGWGIHLTPKGWLYNVSGMKAVQIRLRSGKSFLLGTDEPERLQAAIEQGMTA